VRTEEASFVGTKVGRYGGEEYVAVDVHLSDGQRWLFWPSDLEEIASPKLSLGRSLLSGESRS
jgi:hypothetical protein